MNGLSFSRFWLKLFLFVFVNRWLKPNGNNQVLKLQLQMNNCRPIYVMVFKLFKMALA